MHANISNENTFLKKRFIQFRLYHETQVFRRVERYYNHTYGGFVEMLKNVNMLMGEKFNLNNERIKLLRLRKRGE